MRLTCVSCRCEIERVEIARGRVVAICAACEAFGDAAELAAGVSLRRPAPLPRLRVIDGLPPKGRAVPAKRRSNARVA
jgi:hypothetical protein